MANRVLATIRKLFKWAVERGAVDGSPAAGITPPGKEESRNRVLHADEFRTLFEACNQVGFPYGPLTKLLLLTGQRLSEIAQIQYGNIEGDVRTIPKTKSGVSNEVPLSPSAITIIKKQPVTLGPYLFTTTGGDRPVAGFSKGKKKLDTAIATLARSDDYAPISPWRFHDLRRTCATALARLQVPPHVIERVLNHSTGETTSGVAGIYNRYGYLNEKRQALEAWANQIDAIVSNRNVVTLAR